VIDTPSETPSDPPSEEPTETPSESPTETPTETPTESPTETPSETPTVDPNAFGWYYLSDLDPIVTRIGQNCTGGCTSFRSGPGNVAGQRYPQSYTMRVKDQGQLSSTTWNALRACTVLEATVGLDDKSDTSTAKFTITRDEGTPLVLATLRTGQSQKVSVPLRDVYRFVLNTYLTKTTESGDQYTVWGDARMYCTAAVKPDAN
jgi:hypothetical protein